MYMPGRFLTAERPSRILICSSPYTAGSSASGVFSSGSDSLMLGISLEDAGTETQARDAARRVRGEKAREHLLRAEAGEFREKRGAAHLDGQDSAPQGRRPRFGGEFRTRRFAP